MQKKTNIEKNKIDKTKSKQTFISRMAVYSNILIGIIKKKKKEISRKIAMHFCGK